MVGGSGVVDQRELRGIREDGLGDERSMLLHEQPPRLSRAHRLAASRIAEAHDTPITDNETGKIVQLASKSVEFEVCRVA